MGMGAGKWEWGTGRDLGGGNVEVGVVACWASMLDSAMWRWETGDGQGKGDVRFFYFLGFLCLQNQNRHSKFQKTITEAETKTEQTDFLVHFDLRFS